MPVKHVAGLFIIFFLSALFQEDSRYFLCPFCLNEVYGKIKSRSYLQVISPPVFCKKTKSIEDIMIDVVKEKETGMRATERQGDLFSAGEKARHEMRYVEMYGLLRTVPQGFCGDDCVFLPRRVAVRPAWDSEKAQKQQSRCNCSLHTG